MNTKEITNKEDEVSITPTYDKLSVRAKNFIKEYIVNRVAVKAYMVAYKNDNYESSAVSSTTLLKKPKIQRAIEEKIAENWDERESLISKVLDEMKSLAFSDVNNFKDPVTGKMDLKDKDLRSIKSLDFYNEKVLLYDKNKALSDIAEILGMKKDNDVKVAIQIVHMDAQDDKL